MYILPLYIQVMNVIQTTSKCTAECNLDWIITFQCKTLSSSRMCRVLNYMIFLCIQMILESTKFFRTLQMKSRKNQKLAVITMCENKNMVWPLHLPIHKVCTKRNNCYKTYVDVVSCFPFLYHLKDGEGSANTSHVKLPLSLTSISTCCGGDAANLGATAKRINKIISCIVQ